MSDRMTAIQERIAYLPASAYFFDYCAWREGDEWHPESTYVHCHDLYDQPHGENCDCTADLMVWRERPMRWRWQSTTTTPYRDIGGGMALTRMTAKWRATRAAVRWFRD